MTFAGNRHLQWEMHELRMFWRECDDHTRRAVSVESRYPRRAPAMLPETNYCTRKVEAELLSHDGKNQTRVGEISGCRDSYLCCADPCGLIVTAALAFPPAPIVSDAVLTVRTAMSEDVTLIDTLTIVLWRFPEESASKAWNCRVWLKVIVAEGSPSLCTINRGVETTTSAVSGV